MPDVPRRPPRTFGGTRTMRDTPYMPPYHRPSKENRTTMHSPEPVPEEMSESIRTFLEQVECCRNEIQRMRDHIECLKRCHSQIQRSTNESTRKEIENKVEDMKTTITSSIIAIRNNVKSIREMFGKRKISPALTRMREVQVNSLVRALNEITEEYYNCLVDHSEKCKSLLYNMMSITNENKADFEELLEKGKVAFFTNNLLLNELELKMNIQDVESRRADLLKVEKSILELRNLTQDLSLVVAVQAEKVELLEQYVEKTGKKVDDSTAVMKKASKLKNKGRRRKLIITLLCLSFMIFVLTITILV